MKRWLLSLFAVLVCLCSVQAQVPATTPGSLSTPGFTVNSFDGQYIYYNDNDGETHRVAVTPIQVLSPPVNPCIGQQTAINTNTNTFFYCNNNTWMTLSGPGAPGTITGTTPTVTGVTIAYTNNSSPVIVSNLNGGSDGQLLSIVCKDTNTSFADQTPQPQTDGSTILIGNIITSTGTTISCQGINSVFTFLYSAVSAVWIQISSSSAAGGGATPPPSSVGNTGQFIANNQGILAGTPAFTYNFNNNVANLTSQLNIGNLNVATNFDFFQGPIPSIVPGAVGLSAPPQVQDAGLKILLPGFFGGGIWSLSPTTPYVQSFTSGDINHSIARTVSNSSVRPTVICDLSWCQQGSFLVWIDVSSSSICANPAGAAVQFTLGWQDDVGVRSLVIPLDVNGGSTLSSTIALGTNNNIAHGVWKFYNGGPSNITISSSYTPCTSGTATYNWDAQVIQLQ